MRSSDAFSFGPFSLFPGMRVLQKGGSVVPLGSRAFDMLVAMVERHGSVVTPEELMAIAWPGIIVVESNVRVQVANLRRTLGCGRDGARYITNVAGRGYCFVEAVRRIDPIDESAPPLPEPAAAAPVASSLVAFPAPLEGAIGREACTVELAQIVRERRLVTVVGAAGAGKTTLATLVAHALDCFEGAMFFVDLSVVDREDMVTEALAAAVGYLPPGGELLPGLIEILSARRTLIVLDNCEHVISAAASLCQQIVQGTRSVTLMSTSREALRVREEFVYLLRPLAFPPEVGARLTTSQAMAWPAIELFMERAWEGGARGAMRDDEAETVADLCRRLDGNPHAIGLVASRVGHYGIQGVADLFEGQLALQWQGRRHDSPRHQTVEALIEWSYNLLSERDRQVLQRLSVFSGSFSVEAAVAVTSDETIDAFQVREAVGNLVDKSLVAVGGDSDETHLRLLETTKAYATARLARLPGGERFARRHALHYAEQLRKLSGGQLTRVGEWPRLLELGNVRAAIAWAFSAGNDPTLATTMWCMAAPFFIELGLIRECKRTCERAIGELPDQFRSTATELRLMDLTAITYFAGSDYDGPLKSVLERGLELSQQLADTASMFHFLTGLHLQAITNGDFESSLALCKRYSALAGAHGGPSEAIIAGWMTGSSKHYVGDMVGAEASFAESVQLFAEQGVRQLHYFEVMKMIIAGINTARVRWALGRPTQALQLASSVIDEGRKLPGSLAMRVTLCFHILLGHGLYDVARGWIEELENLSVDYNTSVRRQVLDVNKGFLRTALGESEAAIRHLQQCLALLPPPKMSVVRTDALQALAESQLAAGDAPGALASIDEAIELSRETKGEFTLPDLLRTKAEVLLWQPGARMEAVDALLSEAVKRAREQGALMWELRLALTLVKARTPQGKGSEARQMLEQVYSRFSEGFEANDLKAAAQLLQASN
jgi:predicted ATPase/DNA-binding winged helix-turn-helix (wHTH) protein